MKFEVNAQRDFGVNHSRDNTTHQCPLQPRFESKLKKIEKRNERVLFRKDQGWLRFNTIIPPCEGTVRDAQFRYSFDKTFNTHLLNSVCCCGRFLIFFDMWYNQLIHHRWKIRKPNYSNYPPSHYECQRLMNLSKRSVKWQDEFQRYLSSKSLTGS